MLTDHGTLGVHVFFVISGFLITTLLIEEQTKTGRISLGLFYARRFLRIFPPFYVFLAVIVVGSLVGLFHVPTRDFVFASTYTMNYNPSGVWITGHLWSLSVEEQFYLAWPLTMKLAGSRRAYFIAGALAIGAPLVCLIAYLVNHPFGSSITKYFPLVADPIAAGCVLAPAAKWISRQRQVTAWFGAPAGDLVIPLILLLDLGRNHPRVHLAFTETALNLCVCYAIIRYTQFSNGRIGRLLNNPVPAFVGKISYSLYLWQQVFMNGSGTDVLRVFPVNVAASVLCAVASWYIIEKPMAGMRRRLRAPALPSPAAVF